MTDVQTMPSGQVADAAKLLETGDIKPKILDEKDVVDDKAVETKAPPSTPIKTDEELIKNKKNEAYPHFPKFKVTWDSSIPSVTSLKSPGKKKRRNSQSAMAERQSVLTAQEMSPQVTLVEFIATSASYHGVRRQNLTALEDELFRVFRNNVMPANAAAWYMAKRRFYNNQKSNQNQLLPMLLKEYPKKFAIKNNVVQFLETFSPNVARMKLKYLVEQGLYAYFSHKADEYGVYFFDPLYYEETEPFHANLRLVTNIYNNQKIKLVPAFFKKYKKQFHYKQISPYLVAISKVETEIISGVTGVVVTMLDKKYGLIKFNRNTESCLALFSTSALYHNGYKLNTDPKTLPPVFFDAYKLPESDRGDKFKWFATLTWVGRRPNPKFCATKVELANCPQYKLTLAHNALAQNPIETVPATKKQEEIDYMKMGIVKEVRKNGAVAVVKEEGDDKEQKFWIPGWAFTHVNTPKIKYLTTTKGVGLSIGDLVNFYIDPNLQAKPYDAVACNVDVFKHAEVPNAKSKQRIRKKSTTSSKGKAPQIYWKDFLMQAELDPEDKSEADPDWIPPEDFEDSDEIESDISDDEVTDLSEALKKEIKIDEILPPKTEEKPSEPEEKNVVEDKETPKDSVKEISEVSTTESGDQKA